VHGPGVERGVLVDVVGAAVGWGVRISVGYQEETPLPDDADEGELLPVIASVASASGRIASGEARGRYTSRQASPAGGCVRLADSG
jgi:hypothetical protein